MQGRGRITFIVALIVAASFSRSSLTADLPKEGTFSGTSSFFGTYKVTALGTEGVLVAFDEQGFSLSDGLLDHMTWHCWGTTDYTDGHGQGHGYCVGIDPDGDKVAINIGPDEKHEPRQKSWSSPTVLTTGTGKYTGITGHGTYVNHANEFWPSTDGTFVNYVTFHGEYRLP